MWNRLLWFPAHTGIVLATALPGSAQAAIFRLPKGEFTATVFADRGMTSSLATPNARALWSPRPDGLIMAPARRLGRSPSRLLDQSAIRSQTSIDLFARRVHFQRFRLFGINGTAPFPIAAFELGLKNRFFGDRLMINTEVFRYRHGGYRLTLPAARGYSGVAAVLPSLGMSSRTTGAEVQAGYKLSAEDYAGIGVSYTHARRSSLPTLVAPNRQITNVSSFQVVPSYEHIMPLAHGRSLAFDAAAIYRSSVRVADGLLLSPITGFDASVRNLETTRFEASLTYRSNARFSMSAFVRNITDVRPERSTPLTTRNLVNPSTVSAVLSEPRTFGLSLSARL